VLLQSVPMTAEAHEATFLFSSRDQPGLVARLSGFFYERGLNIIDASNFTDTHGERGPRFFMRLVVDLAQAAALLPARAEMETAFAQRLATPLAGEWSVSYSDRVTRIAIMVTRDATCLYDLALRQRQGDLHCEIALVISNHPELRDAAQAFGLPFVVLPVTKETKPMQEANVLALLKEHHVELVVLARYMQVLSDDFLRDAPPVINIHHGFLPAFQGARPYHQAHARGVKLIGATAHYATKDLDEGPIIEQDVTRISHAMSPEGRRTFIL
jgi:formyltetrahydrofolate deformylase